MVGVYSLLFWTLGSENQVTIMTPKRPRHIGCRTCEEPSQSLLHDYDDELTYVCALALG
jgi:hypothetical protein